MEGIPEEDLKEHERQKQGKSKNDQFFITPIIKKIEPRMLKKGKIAGGKNSDSDDEAPAKKHKPENQNTNNAMSGLPPGMMTNVMPPQFPPMMGHMGHVAPPYMGPG